MHVSHIKSGGRYPILRSLAILHLVFGLVLIVCGIVAALWALFRLFSRAQVSQGRVPEEFSLTFSLGERSVTYVVRAGSVFNPFALRELSEFRCPTLQ